jgi:hypothetical protein
MAWSPDESDRVRELLKLGERLGYLTYAMLNEELPDDVIAPERLDRVLAEIDRRNIRLIDEAEAPELYS